MYSADIDLADDNNSHTLIVKLVGQGRQVLDLGCADGSVGRALSLRDCTVTGVEVDPAAAHVAEQFLHEVLVADLETLDLAAAFHGRQFDTVICGDVLEHMRDPATVMRAAVALLAPDGCVVASVPNVAHGGVRLALLSGDWNYQDRGLLDRTHLRFYTRRTLLQLFEEVGLVPLEVRVTTVGVFEGEVRADPHAVPADAVALVEADPDALTYQFVIKAVADRPGSELATMAYDLRRLERELEEGRTAAAASGIASQSLTQEVSRLRNEVQEADDEARALREAVRRLEGTLAERDETEQARVAELPELQRRTVRAEALRSQADELLARRTDQVILQAARRGISRLSRSR